MRDDGKKYFVAVNKIIFLIGILFCGACAKKDTNISNETVRAVDAARTAVTQLSITASAALKTVEKESYEVTKEKKQVEEKRQRIAELLGVFGETERKNIEEYIAFDAIGEGGANDLDQLIIWKKSEMDGTFIADGFGKEDQVIAKKLAEKTGKIPCWINRGDFDGDGRTEFFVCLFDLKDDKVTVWDDKEIWFAAADGTLQMLEEGVNFGDIKCLKVPGQIYFKCKIFSDSYGNTCLYQVEGSFAKRVEFDCRYGLELLEDGRIRVTCRESDRYSLLGHYGELIESDPVFMTYKHYYYYHDEKGFHEYSGVPVTTEEFCQYDNGEAILQMLREKYMEVKNIYYYADRRMIVNFTEGNIGYEGRPCNNYYLQVPILSEGEEGFVLEWDKSYDLWELIEREEMLGYDLFVSNGIYQQSYMPEFAQFPEFQSPLTYYKEKYRNVTKESLKLCTLQKEEPDGTKKEKDFWQQGEVLVDGKELAQIDGDGRVLRFDKNYDTGALLGKADRVSSVGIWIDGEYICSGVLQKGAKEGEKEADCFLAIGKNSSGAAYQNCLIYRKGEQGEAGSGSEGVQVRLRAFAEITGLWNEETEKICAIGEYEAGKNYRIDLNGNGIDDILYFGEGSLWINGKNFQNEIENRAGIKTEAFILCDIDTGDGIWEIGLWEPDSGPEGRTGLYWYDGECLRLAGSVEGLWTKWGEAVKYCYDGEIRVKSRLHILQVWWTEKVFRLNEEHKIKEDEWDEWYFMEDYKEELFPYWVLAPIRLYTDWTYYVGGESIDFKDYVILQPGERFFTVRTNDKNLITIETEHGPYGALYLVDGMKFEKPEGGFYERPAEVIGGLRLE
ncbi:MAG: hypothetical protein K2N63_12105 [Lachnospiraceae bacterium]|nr:hypothetical protein [Lachnospiraceae bacterium]